MRALDVMLVMFIVVVLCKWFDSSVGIC